MANLLIREGRPAEIMLVEDNRGDALLAARAFRQAEIENNLTVAETGEKALAMLRRNGALEGELARAMLSAWSEAHGVGGSLLRLWDRLPA